MTEHTQNAAGLDTTSIPVSTIGAAFRSQYAASLTMLEDTITQLPEDLWARDSDLNKSWQIGYHALYFTHVYLMPTSADVTSWSGQHAPSQNDDCTAGEPDPASELPLLPAPYSKQEVLDYLAFVREHLEEWLSSIDLTSPDCGFHWYSVSKLEHQLVSLRHLQLHTGQLMERLRSNVNVGIRWRGKG